MYGPGPVQGPGRRMSKYRSVAGSSTSGQTTGSPGTLDNLAQTRKHGLIVTILSSVLSSRRNLDHCIIVVYVVSVGVVVVMEDDIWTTGHV